ncbi:MAG: Crp/Fnr family transcriptional regulator [Phyllobacteriaceae bacterium]|nr:Crp/Fnr family transcriptional regulator [Phyllobacteriaceae bacterium]
MANLVDRDGRTGNNLIDSLRPTERALLASKLTSWHGDVGKVIHSPGQSVEWAYFPLDRAMVSYRVGFDDGREVETALIGREGAVGGIVSRGHLPAFALAVVQFDGCFGRISLSELEALKTREPRIAALFNRYADCLVAQIFQAGACNASHTIEQRAAKWLIAACDRTGSDELSLTQDQLAGLLGVGRSYTTRVIGRFKAEGVVETRRGRLTVRDRDRLAAAACDCDHAVRRHFEMVLRGVYPDP